MPPKQSQAGRFKPRPAKKIIRPGATTSAPVPPPAPNSSGLPTRSPSRGGGRGGRGGRRPPIQQGPAFHGANRPTTTRSAAATSSHVSAAVQRRLRETPHASARSAAAARRAHDQAGQEEEIVGQLEESIGSAHIPDSIHSVPKLLRGSGDETKVKEPTDAPVELPPAAYEYDSDSSMELDIRAAARVPSRRPLTLPFPAAKYPPGVGAPTQQPSVDELAQLPPISPFCGLANVDDLEEENSSWFLLQLPTRLPNLPGTSAQEPPLPNSEPDPVAEVATPPLRKECFDNSLVKASPGKIGKFVVYESGKTVLVLDGEDGRPYRLDVTEGLSCSFRQQAVVIDDSNKEFCPVGDVGKTIVVTPDIETVF